MGNSFKDKVVLITGGSFGIGKATALLFAAKGAKIVLVDWVENPETVEEIEALGTQVLFIKCDVSKTEAVKIMIARAVIVFGRLDYAFNNAGIEGISASVTEGTEENWDKIMAVNLKGIWNCMKFQIPEMQKTGQGAIVNCASIAGLRGYRGLSAYVASKHGIIGLTKTAALECAQQGIRINAVCPGAIKTAMIDRLTGHQKEVEAQFAAQEPMGRLGQPEEVAQAVLWLCSNQASFITGHALTVDGGWTAG